MAKLLTVLGLCVILSSCSALDAMDVLKPSQGIETNVALGKNVETEKNNIKLESGGKSVKQEAEVISNDTKYEAGTIKNITQNIPIEYLVLFGLVAGWAVPSPSECYRGSKVIVSDLYTNLVAAPFKGMASFILKLFNRQPM